MHRRELLKWSGAAMAAGLAAPALAMNGGVAGDQLAVYFADASAAAKELGFTGEALQAALPRQALMVLAGSYTAVFGSDIENPEFIPYIPYFMPYLAPNPDTFYGIAPIDSQGVYRVSGTKGTETIAGVVMRDGGAHLGRLSGRRVGEIDLASIEADDDGNFSFLLSRERPADNREQWFALPAETRCLMARRVTKTLAERDGQWDVQRLDLPPKPLAQTLAKNEERVAQVLACAKTTFRFLLGYMNGLRAKGAEQGFILDEQTDYGGLVSQIYFFHLFNLAADEALIIESTAPAAKYWSLQVLDPFATSLDFVHHQTFMNDAQAHVDADGKVRFVLCASDPGVANWLDSGGWQQGGGLLWRWNEAAETPQPTVRKIKLSGLRAALPAGTLWLDEAGRREALTARAHFYKNRRLF
ncbi:MAG: DUF1214 domain-containing protein [Porticoccaceae bacterium]